MASITAAASAVAAPRVQAQRRVAPSAFVGAPVARRQTLVARPARKAQQQQSRGNAVQVFAVRDGQVLDRPLRVAVIGGGPSGACAAEALAKGGCETYLIERKMDNCKVRSPRARRKANTSALRGQPVHINGMPTCQRVGIEYV